MSLASTWPSRPRRTAVTARLLAHPVALALGAAVAIGGIGGGVAWSRAGGSAGTSALSEVSQSSFETAIGVRVTRVALTAGGGLLDLRYQVLDPDRATAVHARGLAPAVIDERTGTVMWQLLMDHQHSGDFRRGQTYYLLLHNVKRLIRPGAMVAVRLGGALLEHVRVE